MEKKLRVQEKLPSQALLMPITLEFTGAEATYLTTHLAPLQRMGLAIRPFGGKSFMIDALPPHLEPEDVETVIHELIAEERSEPDVLKKLCCTFRSAPFSREELICRLLECEEWERDPLGRPTYSILSREELQKRFQA